MLNDRRGLSLISAHALFEDLFRVVGSLDQRSTFNVAKSILFRRI